jgi:hypothetical protein
MRCPFEFAKTHFPEGKLNTYAEVGVYAGVNTDSVLEGLDIQQTYLIDTWGINDFFLCEMRNRTDGDVLYDTVKAKYADRADRIEILRLRSQDAAQLVPNGLDLVYIDANHAYEGVKSDIESWYPKVRSGGIISGDDYHYYPGVVQAVDEFFGNHPELTLQVGNTKTQWWAVKP